MSKLILNRETLRTLSNVDSLAIAGAFDTDACETNNYSLCRCVPDTRHGCKPNTSGGMYC